MHVIVATDADWVLDQVVAALDDGETTFTVCRDGRAVSGVVASSEQVDLAVLDLQSGSMGGMATAMALRLDESSGRLPHVPALILLDRRADVHLARRSGAEGWIIKPLDPLRLRRAARALIAGGTFTESGTTLEAPEPPGPDPDAAGIGPAEDGGVGDAGPADAEPATTG